jgi:hypothetical protein
LLISWRHGSGSSSKSMAATTRSAAPPISAQRRQRWLEKQGYRVVRVSAATVLQETAAAVQAIVRALSAPRDA